jgi:putative SOS response-associated peptidase YedK
MCGRFALTLPHDAVKAFFAFEDEDPFPPRFNIAPGQPILTVRETRDRRRHSGLVRWGYSPNLPGRTNVPPAFLINARAETIREKPSFRAAFRRRRCLVPADAFYEWHAAAGRKAQPFLFQRRDGAPLAFAAIWDIWTGPNGEEVDTACIITTSANEVTSEIHARLPAMIERERFALWLDPDETRAEDAYGLLVPAPLDCLTWRPIGDLVNKTSNDGPAVQAPLAPPSAPVQGSLF